jgi:GNAT superfamily N-acetyltransferase
MINDLSILPSYRHLGLARALMKQVALTYSASQSIWLLPGPVTRKVEDANNDYSRSLYSAKKPNKEQLIEFYNQCGFALIEDAQTQCGLPVMVSTPSTFISVNNC